MHFIVGVITKHGSIGEIDDALEKFNESLEVERYIYETKAEYLNSRRARYGEYLASADYQKFVQGQEVQEHLKELYESTTHGIGLKDAMALNDDDFIKYVIKIEGASDDDFDEHGNHMQVCNPDGRWDWYVIGGRWENYLRLRDGTKASIAQISKINFKASEENIRHLKLYWERVVEGKESSEIDPDEIRWGPNKENLLKVHKTKENYIQSESLWVPGAFVNLDGDWIEDENRWGDRSVDLKEAEVHQLQFFQLIETYKDYYFAVVDCHC